MDDLKHRFTSLWEETGEIGKAMSAEWLVLKQSYTQSFRAYHNLSHLREMFAYFEVYQSELTQPNTVAWAIFYHDLIYNIWRKDNELKSALEAENRLKLAKIDIKNLQSIKRLIMVTKDHQAQTEDEKWMVDFDLAILGQSEAVYQLYTNNIRLEYKRFHNLCIPKEGKRYCNIFWTKTLFIKLLRFVKNMKLRREKT
jgi:predicted metal-dependent HD superfamily phosphohydrolase